MKISSTKRIGVSCEVSIAYRAPIYLDVKKIMTGYGPLPASEGVIKEVNWGEKKGYRILRGFGKEFCKETIIEKENNKYWKYELDEFKNQSFFFITKVEGEIWVKKINHQTQITSKYSFYNKNIFTPLVTFSFVHLLWRGLQKKALKNIKKEIE